jgi:hypothetical protein
LIGKPLPTMLFASFGITSLIRIFRRSRIDSKMPSGAPQNHCANILESERVID